MEAAEIVIVYYNKCAVLFQKCYETCCGVSCAVDAVYLVSSLNSIYKVFENQVDPRVFSLQNYGI